MFVPGSFFSLEPFRCRMYVRFVLVFFHAFVVFDTLIYRVNTLTTPEERHVSVCVTDSCEVHVIDVFETMYYRRF